MAKKILMQVTQLLVSSHSRSIRQKAGMISIYPKRVEKHKEHKGSKQTVYNNRSLKAPFPHDYDYDEREHLGHTITRFGSRNSRDEAERQTNEDIQRFANLVKAKTLQNRFFKPPKTPSLLTWACKEQIRFLHAKDPDEWCSEALAETFPVSEADVKEILKSRKRLLTVKDKLDHDLHVKGNWEKILSLLESKSHSQIDEEVEKVLSNIGDEDNLLNILPSTKKNVKKQVSFVRKKLGTFSSIVQDELERKEVENSFISSKHEEQLGELRKTLLNIKKILLDSKQSDRKFSDVEIATTTLSERQNSQGNSKAHHDPYELSTTSKGEKTSDTKSYIIDGCVYSEDGEFLYRLP